MEKRKYDTNQYSWRQTASLPKPEGEIMQEILRYYECENISQFCKKIVRNEVVLPLPTDNASQDDINVLKAKLAQYERIITNNRMQTVKSVSSEHLPLRWHLRSEPEILSVWELPLP